MTKDGPSVPKTPLSTKVAPPFDPCFDLAKTLVERAATLLDRRPARARVVLFEALVAEIPMQRALAVPSVPSLADMFAAAFNDSSGGEFWRLRLQAPIGPGQFVEMLATFLAVEGGDKAHHKSALFVDLIRDFSPIGLVPSVVEIEHSPVVGFDEDRQAIFAPAQFYLRGDSFIPDKPLQWMVERELYHDRLPASLITFLTGKTSTEAAETALAEVVPTSGVPGRPTSTHLVKLKLAERGAQSKTLKTCKAEAEWLSAWLQREHPGMPQVGAHRLQTSIAVEYRKIPKSIPK